MKKRRVWMKILIAVGIILAAMAVVSVVLAGSMGGIGPFAFLQRSRLLGLPGNAEQYHLSHVEPKADSPLAGKRALFLGSSVTKGACALDVSMADDIGKLDGVTVTKEAVSGTTLSTAKPNSYVERLSHVDTKTPYDFIVVQLSTNDASQKMELGELSAAGPDDLPKGKAVLDSFDTTTVTGAIESIIAYCRQTWDCPVVFYTGTKYDSERYAAMVSRLQEVQKKWGIGVVDLWNDPEMNAVSGEERSLYMADDIHPTQAGYLLWWTPKIEAYLYDFLT